MKLETRFSYGEQVKDIVTGVTGTITAFAYYFDKDTDKYLISYKNENGSLIEDWLAEKRLIKA